MDNKPRQTSASSNKATPEELVFQASLLNLMNLGSAPVPALAFEQLMRSNPPLAV